MWILRFACFCQVAGIGFLGAFEAVQMRVNGLSNQEIGLLLAIQYALIIVVGPLWGRFADRTLKYRETVIFGAMGLMATAWVFSYATSFNHFLLYTLMRGFFFPALNGVMPSLAVHNLSEKSQGKGFGSYRAFGSIGFIVSTSLLPLIFVEVGLTARAAASLLPFCLLALTQLKNPEAPKAPVAFRLRSLPFALWLFFIPYFFVSMIEPAMHGFYGAYANSIGASDQWIGLMSGLTGLLALIGLPLMGSWIDLRGPKLILLLAFAAQGLRMLVTAQISDPGYLWIPQLFHCIGWAGKEVGTIILVSQLVGPANKATAMTLTVSVKVMGMMAGAWLMGIASDLYGYPAMFTMIGSFGILSCGILMFLKFDRGVKPQSGG